MNTELEIYLKAVSTRKPWDKAKGLINTAIVQQLQEDDIPRLLKMLDAFLVLYGEEERTVPNTVLELARNGNCARWGSYEPKTTAPDPQAPEGKTNHAS